MEKFWGEFALLAPLLPFSLSPPLPEILHASQGDLSAPTGLGKAWAESHQDFFKDPAPP